MLHAPRRPLRAPRPTHRAGAFAGRARHRAAGPLQRRRLRRARAAAGHRRRRPRRRLLAPRHRHPCPVGRPRRHRRGGTDRPRTGADRARLRPGAACRPARPRRCRAGIGKTALLDDVGHEARARGWTLAWGRCVEAGMAPALWPWIEALRSAGPRPAIRSWWYWTTCTGPMPAPSTCWPWWCRASMARGCCSPAPIARSISATSVPSPPPWGPWPGCRRCGGCR